MPKKTAPKTKPQLPISKIIEVADTVEKLILQLNRIERSRLVEALYDRYN